MKACKKALSLSRILNRLSLKVKYKLKVLSTSNFQVKNNDQHKIKKYKYLSDNTANNRLVYCRKFDVRPTVVISNIRRFIYSNTLFFNRMQHFKFLHFY